MMRILFWSENFLPLVGGAEVLAARLVSALQERGHTCKVVTSLKPAHLPSKEQYNGTPVHRFPFRDSSPNIDQVVHVRQQVAVLKQEFRPDVIHISAVDVSNLFHLITIDVHPAPVLVTLHNVLRSNHVMQQHSWLRRLLRSVDWISCVSSAVLADTHRRVPETVRYSSVLYNGLDTPIEAPTPLPTDAPQLLCLGRLKRHKGFDLALTAFASIVSRFPRAQLTIAGDGPERPKLEQQAQSLGLGNAVAFTGWVAPQDVPPLVNTASLVVMPSRREAFGLVALDAAVMARPIVATRVGGLVEVVEHQHTGLLVENEDAEALAQAIAFLLNHPQVAIRMGQAARQRAQERFSWQQYVTAYERLYKKLSARAD